jgi:hypothetical protein
MGGATYGSSLEFINASRANSLSGLITANLMYAFDAARPQSYSGGLTISDLNNTTVVGTLTNGPSFTSEDLGSIIFDGSNDYIALADGANTSTPIVLPQACSVYFWIRVDAHKTDNGLFSHWSGGPVNVGFYINSAGKLSCAQYDGQWNYYSSTGASVPTGTWVHVAFTRANSSLGPLNMYLNGQLNHTVTVVSPRSLGGGNMGSIGTMWYPSNLDGNMSMMQVYSIEHTISQVQQQFGVHRKRYGV